MFVSSIAYVYLELQYIDVDDHLPVFDNSVELLRKSKTINTPSFDSL